MTRYLLDTNVLTELEDRRKPGFALVATRLTALDDTDEVVLSILSVYEYRHGISKAPEDLKESLLMAWRAFEERIQEFHPALRIQNWLADEASTSDLEGSSP